jgi:hypothetical protein
MPEHDASENMEPSDTKAVPSDWSTSINQSNSPARSGTVIGRLGGSIHGARSQGSSIPYSEQFVIDAKYGVTSARASYLGTMRIYWLLRAAVIISGVVVTVLAAVGGARWIVAVVGGLVAIGESTIIATNIQSRAVARGQLAEGMAREIRHFEMRRGIYAGSESEGVLFDRIESLRNQSTNTRFRLDTQAETGNYNQQGAAQ